MQIACDADDSICKHMHSGIIYTIIIYYTILGPRALGYHAAYATAPAAPLLGSREA